MYKMLKMVFSILLIILLLSAGIAEAASKAQKKKISKKMVSYQDKNASLIVDAETGKILHQENAGKLRYPASLTKMMTLYLLFESVQKNKLNLDQYINVSYKAARQPKSNLELSEGDQISVRDAIHALVIKSANDVAVAVAEKIGGNEENFAKIMTKRAKDLGMKNTIFKNASGLPNPTQKTTAYDLARLAIALRRDFPDYYHYFSKTSFEYGGVTHQSHNRVALNYEYADGLKTGYIRASGFNLVTSAKKEDKKLIGVVLGGRTAQMRDKKMIDLLDKYINTEYESKHGYVKTSSPMKTYVSSKKSVKTNE